MAIEALARGAARKIGPSTRSPTARSTARAVRVADPGDNEHASDLVAVEPDRVGLHVPPRTADMGSGRDGDQPRRSGKADDGGEPTGDGSAGPALGLELAPEALDVGAAHGEQSQVVLGALTDKLGKVPGIGVTGEPAIAGQGELLGRAEQGIDALDGGRRRWTFHSDPSFEGQGPGREHPVPRPLPEDDHARPGSIRPPRPRWLRAGVLWRA